LHKKEQIDIAHQCKTNPKKIWNYVNSKFKNKNKIGNLSFKNSIGIDDLTNNDSTKADILNNFFTSVFVKEDNTEFTHLNSIPNIPNMDILVIDEEDILDRLSKININKSAGPDGLHPRILYEVRNEIVKALKIIFDYSLLYHQVPQDWRAGNISPISKKGIRTDASNYRPISLTSIICKLFESIIKDHIVYFFMLITYLVANSTVSSKVDLQYYNY